MSGIVFYGTQKPNETIEFYTEKVGCDIWQEQEDCTILRHDNFIFGFCLREEVSSAGIITFFYESKEAVDKMYDRLQSTGENPPIANDKYKIYHFFARDPENRKIEFQYFDHQLSPFISGERLLRERRSQRSYKSDDIDDKLLNSVFDNCRFAPSSHNRQPSYFRVIRDRNIIYKLSEIRGSSSAPIARAPVAVAIISDPKISQRHIQDGCIMAYHLLLSARAHGLGTCWIADMDRDEVKDILGIPRDHYVATVTPIGFPENIAKEAPSRKPLDWYLRDK